MKEMTMLNRLWMVVCLFGLIGCGGGSSGGDTNSVMGVITVNDAPASNCFITFVPEGTTQGNGGTGLTDYNGKYEVQTPQGKKGLPPGRYKVTISRRLNKDGSLPDPNVPPIESSAVETLPAKYVELAKTELTATITTGDNKATNFTLKTGKK